MNTYKVLNLYAGLGGNRYKWDEVAKDAGINLKVTAVELDEKIANLYARRFRDDEVLIGDAHEYLLNNFKDFDFIWTSPPCPTHSKMVKATRHDVLKYPEMALYQEIIILDHFFKGKYVIENVISYYDPLIQPYKSNRHYFWSNFKITPCPLVPVVKDLAKSNRSQMAYYLGFDYEGPNIYIENSNDPAKILRNCVHPEEGKHILETALNIHKSNNQSQLDIFN